MFLILLQLHYYYRCSGLALGFLLLLQRSAAAAVVLSVLLLLQCSWWCCNAIAPILLLLLMLQPTKPSAARDYKTSATANSCSKRERNWKERHEEEEDNNYSKNILRLPRSSHLLYYAIVTSRHVIKN